MDNIDPGMVGTICGILLILILLVEGYFMIRRPIRTLSSKGNASRSLFFVMVKDGEAVVCSESQMQLLSKNGYTIPDDFSQTGYLGYIFAQRALNRSKYPNLFSKSF